MVDIPYWSDLIMSLKINYTYSSCYLSDHSIPGTISKLLSIIIVAYQFN